VHLVPCVTRASGRLGLDARQQNGRFAFGPDTADRIRGTLGSMPRVGDLSSSEIAVLAALRNADRFG